MSQAQANQMAEMTTFLMDQSEAERKELCRTKTNLSSRIVEWFRILRIFLLIQLIELEAQYCRQIHELFLMGNNTLIWWKKNENFKYRV